MTRSRRRGAVVAIAALAAVMVLSAEIPDARGDDPRIGGGQGSDRMTGPKGAAQIAASIAYADAPRPDGLPDDMQPLPGGGLRFLSLTAIDGSAVAAALWQP